MGAQEALTTILACSGVVIAYCVMRYLFMKSDL